MADGQDIRIERLPGNSLVCSDENGAVLEVAFVESPVFETLSALQCLLVPWYQERWADEAREAVGVRFLRELEQVFGPFRNGSDLAEVAVAPHMRSDVPAFIENLRNMPFGEFSYYAFGRLIPATGTQFAIDADELRRLIDTYGVYAHYLERLSDMDWAETGPGIQAAFADLVERFWNRYFAEEIDSFKLSWTVSIAKNLEYAEAHGGDELYRLITGRPGLPPAVPGEQTDREIVLIPVVRIAHHASVYTGEGSVTVIYRASRVPKRVHELSRTEERLIAVAKALGDPTRFRIIKLIFQHAHTMNGQDIAAKLGLTKSVVSKHLRQLRDAGVVSESTRDNRNNIYSVRVDTLTSLSPGILEVLRG